MGNQIGNISFLPFIGQTTMDLPRMFGQREWKPWERFNQVKACAARTGVSTQLCAASGHVHRTPTVKPVLLRLDSTGEVSSEMKVAPLGNLMNRASDMAQRSLHQPNLGQDPYYSFQGQPDMKMHHNHQSFFMGMCDNRSTMPYTQRFNVGHNTGQMHSYRMKYPINSDWTTAANGQGLKPPPSHIGYSGKPGYCNGTWYNSWGYPVQDPINYMGFGPNMTNNFTWQNSIEKNCSTVNMVKERAYPALSRRNIKGHHLRTDICQSSANPGVSSAIVPSSKHSQITKSMMEVADDGHSEFDPIIESMGHLHIATTVQSPGMSSNESGHSVHATGQNDATPVSSSLHNPVPSAFDSSTTSHCVPSQSNPCSISVKMMTKTCDSASSKGLNVHAAVFHCLKDSSSLVNQHSIQPNVLSDVQSSKLECPTVINNAPQHCPPKCLTKEDTQVPRVAKLKKSFNVTVTKTPSCVGNAHTDHGNGTLTPKMTPSSQKKKKRPSSKKRRRLKLQRNLEQSFCSDGLPSEKASMKRQKVKHTNEQTSSTSKQEQISQPSSFSAVAFVFDIGENSCDEEFNLKNVGKEISGEHPPINAKFSFYFSSSDSDYSEGDWDDNFDQTDSSCELSNSVDHELWNSFHRDDDPLNPLSFHIAYTVSHSQGISSAMTRSSSAPEMSRADELDSINAQWNIRCSVSPKSDILPTSDQEVGSTRKKVRFADDHDLVTVHLMETCNDPYEDSRKGPWEQYALDRSRFQDRIRDVEKSIGYIFCPKHREKMADYLRSN